MSLFKRVLEDLKERKDRVETGKVNCIPWGLPRFERHLPGIEQGKYYLITANSKVGKTQITDWLFMYNAFRQIKKAGLPVKLKIFYFSLEMSAEEKLRQMISNLLFIESGYNTIISPKNLRSTREALEDERLAEVESLEEYIEEFLQCVTFIDNIRNPYGIYNYMRNYAKKNGTQHKKEVMMDGKPKMLDDYYEPNDPEEYVMPIVDHAKLLTPERGSDIRGAIGELSSKYFILLRNKYNMSPVLIQQQASSQESVENKKAGRLRPTLDGLGDNKTTQQDANVILGLFSPFRHHIPEYEKYDIKYFRDNIRFLEILGGREGGAGIVCPLYFNGAVNFFTELPKWDDTMNMVKANQLVKRLRDAEK